MIIYKLHTMKSKLLFPALLLASLCLSFTISNSIGSCFLSFKSATDLTAAKPDRLPDDAEKFRTVKTSTGEVQISQADGYRILYYNKKNAPFVNLKVELSDPASYEQDQKHLLEHLNYLNSNSQGMESKELITLDYNGYKIYGLSRGSIDKGSTLGTFVMFPGNNTIVYFYFNNMTPEFRTFTNLEEYKAQRNLFMGEYTKHVAGCK